MTSLKSATPSAGKEAPASTLFRKPSLDAMGSIGMNPWVLGAKVAATPGAGLYPPPSNFVDNVAPLLPRDELPPPPPESEGGRGGRERGVPTVDTAVVEDIGDREGSEGEGVG